MDKVELSAKKELVKSLMRCPHRKLDETISTFQSVLDKDPLFAGKCFYALTFDEFNKIRDLEDSAIAFLLTSPHSEHRDAGRILFQRLEPFRAYRVSKFMKESLKRNRQSNGAVKDYLKTIESNTKRLDGAVKVAASKLHYMYEMYHYPASDRAKNLIFDRKAPEGEVDILEVLRNTNSPEEQAEIIVANKIPYKQATSVIKSLTPAVWVALIEVMSVPEAVNMRAAVEKSGILTDSSIRKLYETKIASAATSKKVASTTLGERKSTKGKDESINKIMKEAEQKKIDTGLKITADTAIFIDCSGSMGIAIEMAKAVCPHIASLCDARLAVYCFNDSAWNVKYTTGTIEDFRKAFNLIRANGGTSLGAPLKKCLVDGFTPEQLIFITDQGENQHPMLADVIKETKLQNDLRAVFINTADNHMVAEQLERLGVDVTEFEFRSNLQTPGWYADMDNFSTLLTKGGYTDIVEKILTLELPTRK